MPKLPGGEDMGGGVSGRASRPIASLDTSAIGRGIASLGEGLGSLAAGVKANEKVKQAEVDQATRFETQRRFLEFSAAQDDALVKEGQNAAPGAFGFREGYTGAYQQAAKEFFATVPEELKPEYDAKLFQVEDGLSGRALTFERQQRKDYYTSSVNDGLTKIENKLYANPKAFDINLREGDEFISSIPDEDISPIDKEAMRKDWRKKAQLAALYGMPAAERSDALGGAPARPLPADVQSRANQARDRFVALGWTPAQAAGIVGNLVQESGVRPDGPDGDNGTASGMAQWRGERLTRLKRFAAANGRDWKDFDTQINFVDMELKNHETDAYQRLKSATTVEEAAAAFIGYERPRGWTPDNPRGGHGWANRLAAAQRTAGEKVTATVGDVDPRFAEMPWQDREKVIAGAETEIRQEEADRRVSAQFAIETASANAPAAIQNTGTYSGVMPTQDQFMAAYGAEAGQKWNAFQQALETSQSAFRMQTMPAEEVSALVSSAEPTSSGDDAALQQARYDTLSKAADATLKAREADPAAYVRRAFPSVDKAWQGVTEPGGYQAAVAASVAAQQQLGIETLAPLPKEIASDAVANFKNEAVSEDNRIASVANVLMATPDPSQRRALFNQLVDAGLPDITEGAFEAMARGDQGAASRLFRAAMTDPSKLPGKLAETPANIDAAIQSALMDDGMIGDVYYGLTNGTAENLARAERDSKLITNAVGLRMRSGEDMDAAIQSVAKDLYGDVQVVTGNGEVNAEFVLPAGEDADAVLSGLAAEMPTVREAISTAIVAPIAPGPTGPITGAVEAGNIDLTKRPTVPTGDGRVATVRSMSFEEDGIEVLIPTVSPDGRLLSDEEAITYYRQTGQHLGKFDTAEAATNYATALHDAQERYYGARASGDLAVMDGVTSAYMDDVLAEGYFRHTDGGYVFIDPFTGDPVPGVDGNPLVVKPSVVQRPGEKTPFSGRAVDDAAARQSAFQ